MHSKYLNYQSIYQNLNDLQNHCKALATKPNPQNKLVVVGECGLDSTSVAPINEQMLILEKQNDLAIQFNRSLVLHCRDSHIYRRLYDCFRNRIYNKNLLMHVHCINNNANLNVVDIFFHEFPNSYIGIKGSITYETN